MILKLFRPCLIFILLTIYCFKGQSHPSWGIVATSAGDVYFVDVMHDNGTLWKYRLGMDKPEAIFSGHFHAHALQVDENDNLYVGLHIWIDGEIMGDGQNYLLKYNTNTGELDTMAFSLTYDALFGGNVVYDHNCEQYYYAHDKKIHQANVYSMDAAPYFEQRFERISTMAMDEKGQLWISDSYDKGGTLYYLDQKGVLKQYARNLIPSNPKNPVFEEKRFQLFYGIGFDPDQKPILSDSASRSIYRVNENGTKETLYKSPISYFPTGVCYVGDLMVIMEVGFVSGEGHKGPRLVIGKNKEFETVEFQY